MAARWPVAAADFFSERAVVALFCSPLERAQETARPVAERLGLTIVTDDRLIESWNHFEGLKFGVGDGSLRRPGHWPHLVNPFRPSWGEPYREVVARMRRHDGDRTDGRGRRRRRCA